MIKWVVFDLGDVVLRATTAFGPLAELLTVAPDAFTAAYFEHRRAYDLHTDPAIFFTDVARSSGAGRPDAALIAELVRIDDLGWSVTDPDMLRLIEELHAARISLAVLSNAPSSMGRLIEVQPWVGPFQHLLFSGDLGLMKPDAEIYRRLLAQLAVHADEVAFLDDRPDNINGAIGVGIHGFVFKGATAARADLRGLGLPV
ncbi:putative hydrolase of the HAD superfamily [Nakamurella sp. UYEF19]|uniref:HAD family hydrolase n=1 Tax=Nakamurella sp. UYEF19 TaxID=1756392 RepID=UPI00339152F1